MRNKPHLRLVSVLVLCTLGLALAFNLPARAGGPVSLSEESLVFNGLTGQPLQRTFTLLVSGASIQKVAVVLKDLSDPQSGLVLLSDKISVDPAAVDKLEGQQRFTVTIQGGASPGHFSGALQLTFQDAAGSAGSIDLPLEVNLELVPTVDAEVNSKNRTLRVVSPFLDLPFTGRPQAVVDSHPLAETSVYLVENSAGPALVEQAVLIAPANATGGTLPVDVLQVDQKFPFSLAGQQTAPLRILANGRNLPAGEYTATLLVSVKHQAAPVSVPIKVQVKDGALLALLLLAVGPLIGLLIYWWNNNGKQASDLAGQIRLLQADIKSHFKLQDEDARRAMDILGRAMDLLVAGTPPDQVQPVLDEAKASLKTARDAVDAFLKDILGSLAAKLAAMQDQPGQMLIQDLRSKVEQIRQKVTQGVYPSLPDAVALSAGIETQINGLQTLQQAYQSLPDGSKPHLKKQLDQAADLKTMKVILDHTVKKVLTVDLTKALDSLDLSELPPEPSPSAPWKRYTWGLQWRRLLVFSLVYIFTLLVGWITLYNNNPTFGAQPQDYVAVLLWGVTANIFSSQTIDLKTLYQKMTS
jgi:hypothetical protein